MIQKITIFNAVIMNNKSQVNLLKIYTQKITKIKLQKKLKMKMKQSKTLKICNKNRIQSAINYFKRIVKLHFHKIKCFNQTAIIITIELMTEIRKIKIMN